MTDTNEIISDEAAKKIIFAIAFKLSKELIDINLDEKQVLQISITTQNMLNALWNYILVEHKKTQLNTALLSYFYVKFINENAQEYMQDLKSYVSDVDYRVVFIMITNCLLRFKSEINGLLQAK